MLDRFIALIRDVFLFIFGLVKSVLAVIIDWVLSLSIFDKLLLLLVIVSPLGILLPFARFFVIDFYYSINNPLSITLIFIATLLFVSLFFEGPIVLGGRLALFAYYLLYTLILFLTNSITKASNYELYAGFFFNVGLAIAVITFSVCSYMERR